MTTDIDAEKLVSVYLKIRDTLDSLREKHKKETQDLKEQLDLVGDKLLTLCNQTNSKSISTKAGTIIRSVKTNIWTTDWDEMYAFIKKHDAPQLLEQRIHKGNMKQFLEENPDELPIGLQTNNEMAVTVRRPNKS